LSSHTVIAPPVVPPVGSPVLVGPPVVPVVPGVDVVPVVSVPPGPLVGFVEPSDVPLAVALAVAPDDPLALPASVLPLSAPSPPPHPATSAAAAIHPAALAARSIAAGYHLARTHDTPARARVSAYPRRMRIHAVRTPGQRDRLHVTRDDGSEVAWVFPTYGAGLPHDLVHWAVESAFDLRHGFWGRVAAGVDPARVNAEAERRGGAGKYAGYGVDLRELLLAECLAAVSWDMSESEIAAQLATQAAALHIDVPAVSPARLAGVRQTLAALRDAWQALARGGTVAVTWPASGPPIARPARNT
jgi:hypothetical protein